MNTLNEEFNFLRSTNFKLLSQTKGNSINNCYFFKFTISVQGSQKHLAVSLILTQNVSQFFSTFSFQSFSSTQENWYF